MYVYFSSMKKHLALMNDFIVVNNNFGQNNLGPNNNIGQNNLGPNNNFGQNTVRPNNPTQPSNVGIQSTTPRPITTVPIPLATSATLGGPQNDQVTRWSPSVGAYNC